MESDEQVVDDEGEEEELSELPQEEQDERPGGPSRPLEPAHRQGFQEQHAQDFLHRGPPHEMDDMVRFVWSNYNRPKRKLYLFELRLCYRALDYLQSEIEKLKVEERPIMLWFRRVELFGDDIEQSLHQFLMKRPELRTITLIGWTRYLGEGASVIDDYIPILNCLNLNQEHQSDPRHFPHHITTVEVEQMRLTRPDIGTLLGGATLKKKVKLSRSTLDAGFLSGFCATPCSPRTLKMVQCFANSNTTLHAMAQNSWQEHNQMFELDLQNNRFTSVALASIADLLRQQQASLRALRLGSNFDLFQQPEAALLDSFVTALAQMRQLHTIQLEACKMDLPMATAVIQAVRTTCRTMNLQGTNLFDDDDDHDDNEWLALGDTTNNNNNSWLGPLPPSNLSPTAVFFRFLATNTCCLVDLVLGGCNIGTFTAGLLFAALERNRTLEKLDLRDNPFTIVQGSWETSLPKLAPQLVQLWLPLTNFVLHPQQQLQQQQQQQQQQLAGMVGPTNSSTTHPDSWPIFEKAVVQNIHLTNLLEPATSRALPGPQRVALSQLALRNKGIARAQWALQHPNTTRFLWPRIMARLWSGWESDQNATAVYAFFRRSAEGEEWRTLAHASASVADGKPPPTTGKRKRPFGPTTHS